MSCTDTNHYGSVCTYNCNEGYVLSNDSLATTTCNDDDDSDAEGEWSSVPPQCISKSLFYKKQATYFLRHSTYK